MAGPLAVAAQAGPTLIHLHLPTPQSVSCSTQGVLPRSPHLPDRHHKINDGRPQPDAYGASPHKPPNQVITAGSSTKRGSRRVKRAQLTMRSAGPRPATTRGIAGIHGASPPQARSHKVRPAMSDQTPNEPSRWQLDHNRRAPASLSRSLPDEVSPVDSKAPTTQKGSGRQLRLRPSRFGADVASDGAVGRRSCAE